MMRGEPVPFVSAEALILLYPELEPVLDTIPSRREDKVRLYNAFIALDVLNALRKPLTSQTDDPATNP